MSSTLASRAWYLSAACAGGGKGGLKVVGLGCVGCRDHNLSLSR